MSTLLVGLSTRAIAESAVRGGHPVVTVDYFGDRDQAELAENLSLLRHLGLPFSARGLLEASRQVNCRQAVYTSNLENHPDEVEELSRARDLLGNSPGVLRRVRDWGTLRAFCRRSEIDFPATVLSGEPRPRDAGDRWLVKPVRGGGGHGIRPWRGERPDGGHYVQRLVPGRPASAAFVADGRRAVLLGLTEQLIGRPALGARGMAWCGNILPLSLPGRSRAAVVAAAQSMADRLTAEFELRGVNGIDLVLSDGPELHLVEVNPRYTAAMELVERAYGLNVFALHLDALAGRLPEWSLGDRLGGPAYGKGIVYARQDVTIAETDTWRARERRDIPYAGDRVAAGRPICTVLAEGPDREACWQRLVEAADGVRRETGDRTGGPS